MNELLNCSFMRNSDWLQIAIDLMFWIMIVLQQFMIISLRRKVIRTETVIQKLNVLFQKLNDLFHSILPNHQK